MSLSSREFQSNAPFLPNSIFSVCPFEMSINNSRRQKLCIKYIMSNKNSKPRILAVVSFHIMLYKSKASLFENYISF